VRDWRDVPTERGIMTRKKKGIWADLTLGREKERTSVRPKKTERKQKKFERLHDSLRDSLFKKVSRRKLIKTNGGGGNHKFDGTLRGGKKRFVEIKKKWDMYQNEGRKTDANGIDWKKCSQGGLASCIVEQTKKKKTGVEAKDYPLAFEKKGQIKINFALEREKKAQ